MSKGGGGVNIPSNYTIAIGSANPPLQVDADIEPITVTSNTNVAVTQPIVTQSTSDSKSTASVDLKLEPLDIKLEPVKADTSSTIDLKPVVVDSCQTIRLAPLPPIRVEQPYSQHFGFTYMGMEIFGFTISGRSEMSVSTPRKCHGSEWQERERESGDRHESPAVRPAAERRAGGLRVRVSDND
jgi:hypothetical protein